MKLLIADDHTLFRDTLVQYIRRAEPQAALTLACDLHEALFKLAQDSKQDLILLDLKMPGMNGLKGLKEVRDLYPNIPVALMSGVAEPCDVAEAMELGAAGYFPKTLSGKALLRGIQQVMAGEVFVATDEEKDGYMPSYYADEKQEATVVTLPSATGVWLDAPLTPRERQVLSFLSQGSSNKEIAQVLGLQVVTVKLHVRGICQKLGVKNRTQAALLAREIKPRV